MRKIIENIQSRFSMIYQFDYFRDIVSGKTVKVWSDKFGQQWMATSKWGMRVKRNATA